MNSAKEHYDQHLGAIYSWMAGDINAALEENRRLFRQMALDSAPKGFAIDLGCATGFQSIPLAEFGYSVLTVDSCAVLLSQLRERANSLPIRTIHDDLLNFTKHISSQAQLVTCMGDTLTHLDSLGAVHDLISKVSRELVEGGMLVLTFRDYVSKELTLPRSECRSPALVLKVVNVEFQVAVGTILVLAVKPQAPVEPPRPSPVKQRKRSIGMPMC